MKPVPSEFFTTDHRIVSKGLHTNGEQIRAGGSVNEHCSSNEGLLKGTDGSDTDTFVNFQSIQEGDENDEKEEMWLPGRRASANRWPLRHPGETNEVWNELHICGDLTCHEKDQLLSLLKRFPKVFPNQMGQLGHCLVGQHHIDTGNNLPVKQRLIRFSR